MDTLVSDKLYITADQLYGDSFILGRMILDSGFRPNFIAALWRGGTPVGIVVQEFLKYHGVQTDHIAIRTTSYTGVNQAGKDVQVDSIEYIVQRANAGDSLLLVDDVFDRGLSVKAVIDRLKSQMRKNLPQDIRVATVYFKPKRNQTDLEPHFYVHETDQWLVFPHELDGLSPDEIARYHGLDPALFMK